MLLQFPLAALLFNFLHHSLRLPVTVFPLWHRATCQGSSCCTGTTALEAAHLNPLAARCRCQALRCGYWPCLMLCLARRARRCRRGFLQ